MFRGKTGLSINEWAEEVQACKRARHLSRADQALFIYDHLESEAREEIKYRPKGGKGRSRSNFLLSCRSYMGVPNPIFHCRKISSPGSNRTMRLYRSSPML